MSEGQTEGRPQSIAGKVWVHKAGVCCCMVHNAVCASAEGAPSLQSPAVATLVAMKQPSATFCPMLLSFPSQSRPLSCSRLGKMSQSQASLLDFSYSFSCPGRRHVTGCWHSTSIWLPGLATLPTSVLPAFQLMEQAQEVPSSSESTVAQEGPSWTLPRGGIRPSHREVPGQAVAAGKKVPRAEWGVG